MFHKLGLRARKAIRTLPPIVRLMLASVLSFFLAFDFAACGPQVADRNIDALNRLYEAAERSGKTLSIKEVESVLGQPTRSEAFPIEMRTTKELPGVRYYYEQDGRIVELHFIDNKLIRRAQRFGEKPIDEAGNLKLPVKPAP
jgi:hypothetical protein